MDEDTVLVPGYRGARGMTALVSGGEYGVVWCGVGEGSMREGRGGKGGESVWCGVVDCSGRECSVV